MGIVSQASDGLETRKKTRVSAIKAAESGVGGVGGRVPPHKKTRVSAIAISSIHSKTNQKALL